jgi:acylphosphatase
LTGSPCTKARRSHLLPEETGEESRVETFEIIVAGQVQKVGFRACVRRIASDLGISGEVANLEDGRVRIWATGEPIILEKFVSMLYGCQRAVIRNVSINHREMRYFDEFSITRE